MKILRKINIFFKQPKVFCVGMNKTGTTTMSKVFRMLNYRVAPQIKQEIAIGDLRMKNNYQKIKSFCWKYNFFQDLPFSQGDFYQTIDKIYPSSKFILTIRDPEKWFDSFCNFHLIYYRKMGFNLKNISEVKEEHMRKFNWIKEGYYYDYTKNFWINEQINNQLFYNWKLLYNKNHYINVYQKRNKQIQDYFQERKKDLLIFDVSKNYDVSKILDFLEIKNSLNFRMPHELQSKYK